ncbi:hypothetical protein PC116_g18157 [Phytophthora cactorum]|nr:hypothetical protein PC115_g24115 [Phytophthora cactorum]KAG4233636.1 hypothetical protein PC116_g18157 [Phytophthora cactorum]
MLSTDMDGFLDLYEMTISSPVFKNASLVDSWQDVDGSLLSWPSLPPPVVQDTDYVTKSNERCTPLLGSKKRRRQEAERNRQRRYRQRLRVERETLENEVDSLSRELEQLKKGIADKQAWASEAIPPIESCWLTATTSEKEKLLHSERERQRLEAAVNMQAAYIEHLRKLVPDDSLDTEVGQVFIS